MRTNFKSFLKVTIIVVITFFNFIMLQPQQVSAQGQGQWISNGSTIVYTNRKVGVKTNLPTKDFDVNGSFRSINAFVDSVLNVWQLITAGNVSIGGTLNVGQFSLSDNNIISSSGNINFGNNNLTTSGNVNASNIFNLQSTVVNQQTKIDSLQSVINNIQSSQWQNNDTNIYFNTGWVGVGTNAPAVKLDVWGNQRITKNLFVGGEVVVSEKFSARTVTSDTSRATKQILVNHNLKLGSDSGSVNSDISSKAELLKIQSDPASIFDVAISVNDSSKVGIGTKYPSEKLSVEGNVSVNGNINTTGNISTNSINASNMNVSGQTSFDSLQVASKIKTNRVTPLPGDSMIYIGNNSLSYNDAGNQIGNSTTSSIKGLRLGNYSSYAEGLNSIAIGYKVGTPLWAANSIVIGSGGTTLLYNHLANSLMVGFNSNIPTLTVRAANGIGTTGSVGIGTTAPDQKLSVVGNIHSTGNIINGGPDFILGVNDGRDSKIKTANRALVHDGWEMGKDNLVINYDGDFEDGVFVGGPKTVFDGNVGIGTSTPIYKLEVCGTIRSKEWIVETGWCDYKFDSNYKRMTWQEKSDYIFKYKHLPEIDSGTIIENEGLTVGKTMKGFISNIEDNTLDIIDLYKIIELQKKEIEQLKKDLQLMKN